MAQPVISQRIVLKTLLDGVPKESDFLLEDAPLPALQDGEVLFKSLYISPDPYQRNRLTTAKVGDVVFGSTVGEVIESKNPEVAVGKILVAYKGWVSHGILTATELKATLFHTKDFPPSTALGVLGMPGMTAYFGLLRVCDPKPGEIVLVSGAAGAVGSLVGQIAKIKGCYVIGVAGTPEKCAWLKTLGFDATINYKTDPLKATLDKYAPNGIDVMFDNIGGPIIDAALLSLKDNARIAICGQISEYNSPGNPSTGPRLYHNLIYKNAKIEGFVCFKWGAEWPEALKVMEGWIKEGKIKYEETIDAGGLAATPRAFISLFTGANTGKQLVKL